MQKERVKRKKEKTPGRRGGIDRVAQEGVRAPDEFERAFVFGGFLYFPAVARSSTWLLLVVCAVGMLLARESRQPASPLAGIDRAFLDWLGANAGPGRASPGLPTITLVEIDDSVADTPRRMPLSALEYASFLHSVARYEPAVVAIAPVLEWAQSPPGTEQLLLDEALALPKLLLGVRLGSSAGNGADPATLTGIEDPRGNRSPLAEFPEIIEAPESRLLALASATGATNLPGSETAPIRDLPLLFRCRERVVPAFTLEILALALKLAPAEISVSLGSGIQLDDRLRLPVDATGRALLDVRALDRVNHLSLDDLPLLIVGQATPEARAAAERMRGGVVILGRTDRAARTLRLPGSRELSAAEAFAWGAASLEEAPATRKASAWWDAGIVAAFTGLGWRALGRSRAYIIVRLGAVLVVYASLALGVFESERIWLPFALPIGLAVLLFAINLLRIGAQQASPPAVGSDSAGKST